MPRESIFPARRWRVQARSVLAGPSKADLFGSSAGGNCKEFRRARRQRALPPSHRACAALSRPPLTAVCRLSGDDVGQQFALDLGDLVLEQELALFQPLQLELVDRRVLGEARDHLVEVAMLGL